MLVTTIREGEGIYVDRPSVLHVREARGGRVRVAIEDVELAARGGEQDAEGRTIDSESASGTLRGPEGRQERRPL